MRILPNDGGTNKGWESAAQEESQVVQGVSEVVLTGFRQFYNCDDV